MAANELVGDLMLLEMLRIKYEVAGWEGTGRS
jgi:hypothetical protein